MARGNRSIKSNPTGQTNTPRLKGNSATTNVGKGTKPAPTPKKDQNAFKRGDKSGPTFGEAQKAEFKRGDDKSSKMPPSLPSKFSRGE